MTEPLSSPVGRAWLTAQLAAAEHQVQTGPNGQGWLHNEARRAAIYEQAAFLRALAALVPPAGAAH